jgi:hypothetical protein
LLARNVYKYPLLIGLPDFYKRNLNPDLDERLVKLFTGFSVAFAEAVITCPVERAKVFFMTSQT